MKEGQRSVHNGENIGPNFALVVSQLMQEAIIHVEGDMQIVSAPLGLERR